MLMRKTPGGIEVPGWGIGIHWNSWTLDTQEEKQRWINGREATRLALLHRSRHVQCLSTSTSPPALPYRTSQTSTQTYVFYLWEPSVQPALVQQGFFAFLFPSIRTTLLIRRIMLMWSIWLCPWENVSAYKQHSQRDPVTELEEQQLIFPDLFRSSVIFYPFFSVPCKI